MPDDGSELRKVMTSVTQSCTRVCVTPSFRDGRRRPPTQALPAFSSLSLPFFPSLPPVFRNFPSFPGHTANCHRRHSLFPFASAPAAALHRHRSHTYLRVISFGLSSVRRIVPLCPPPPSIFRLFPPVPRIFNDSFHYRHSFLLF